MQQQGDGLQCHSFVSEFIRHSHFRAEPSTHIYYTQAGWISKNRADGDKNKVCFKKRGCFAPSKGFKTPIHLWSEMDAYIQRDT